MKKKQGDIVKFNLNETVLGLTGKVCGVVGPVVIVELTDKLESYPYTHIYILDTQIILS